jgi:hypothetical protein
VIVDKHEDKLGQRASNTATITFNDIEVDAKYLLGEENHGLKIAMMTLDRTRPGVAAMREPRSDHEHSTPNQARKREQLAAGPLSASEGPQRPALKRDRVDQSGTTSTPFQNAIRFLILWIHGYG